MARRRTLVYLAAAALVGLVGYGVWLEVGARREGFAHLLDRRAARGLGILDPREWRNMEASGDVSGPASGGEPCLSVACRRATQMLGGRWRGGGDCAVGSRYRFTDAAAIVEDVAAGRPGPATRRSYRIVGATVAVPLGQDGAGRERTVEKRAGDLEIWTLGENAYVRRILRRRDADTVDLVLVQSRSRARDPVRTLYVEGRATAGEGEVVYRRCPEPPST